MPRAQRIPQKPIRKKMVRHRRVKRPVRDLGPDSLPIYQHNPQKKFVAIIQPGSWGDNINSTLMLKPIRQKWPDCVIDIYTSTVYGSAFDNNPYIDNLIKFPSVGKENSLNLFHIIPGLIERSGYNIIFNPHPMINPDKWTSIKHPELGDNLICAWIRALEHADINYEWPLETILHLTEREITRANEFCNQIPEFESRPKTIMEIHAESGQTFWNDSWTKEVINHICSKGEIVLASRSPDRGQFNEFAERFPQLFHFIGNYSIRECVQMFNRCDRFISISSGLSNACNTCMAKKNIRWLEVINSPSVSSAPIRATGKTFWYENNIGKFISENLC